MEKKMKTNKNIRKKQRLCTKEYMHAPILLRLVCSQLCTGSSIVIHVQRLRTNAFMAEVRIQPSIIRSDLQSMNFLCLHVARTRRMAYACAIDRAFRHLLRFIDRSRTLDHHTMHRRLSRAVYIHRDPWTTEVSRGGFKRRVPSLFGSQLTGIVRQSIARYHK